MVNQSVTEKLRELAETVGVSTGFWDWYGNWKHVEDASLIAVLNSLGFSLSFDPSEAEINEAFRRNEDFAWAAPLPPTTVCRQGNEAEIPVHVPHGMGVWCHLETEDGYHHELEQLDRPIPPRMVDGNLVGRATFKIPNWLPQGWHRIVARHEDGSECSSTLIVVPQRLSCRLDDGHKRWGVAAQLYSTRSSGSWGMGDTQDLADLTAIVARDGANFLQVNPLHAPQPCFPQETSPYLPVSRRWASPLYIRPEAIDEYARMDGKERGVITRYAHASRSLEDIIDRDLSWKSKLKALRKIFEIPRSITRQAQFEHFCAEGGESLENFALWSALVFENGDIELPAPYASINAPEVEQARQRLAGEIEFWQWCQWIVFDQLIRAQESAHRLGMDMGIMSDLAVGVHSLGSEIWSMPEIFAPGMSVGAPPDMYSQQGQNWSQPPWSPRGLAKAGYAPLRDMLRSVLSYSGAVRIDHILGLFRLWWIPEGMEASAGAYVSYDHEAMVGIVLLEAQRAGAVVIGEDLGTVEPWVRGYLNDRGILGTSVLWFEKEGSGWPLWPDHYRRSCLAAVTTHDLPPTLGYLEGVHTQLRNRLGLLVEDLDQVLEADRVERERMVSRLNEGGFIHNEEPSEEELVMGFHAYLAASPALLLAVSLVDAVGEKAPQNLPGTSDQYPNWCIPLHGSDGEEAHIEDLAASEKVHAFLANVNRYVR
ncbi:4-alpha-glucanotransferase [uncultured Actinomyces sp.]|uniref:4-alpha-glucanotransferase n=1 Tax=uncultured Actinomyces sp. TaxID=249061 RepID=UPI0028D3C040|nr:4-alpha-glucanotransferase [uncultured Actinomyces sp.]